MSDMTLEPAHQAHEEHHAVPNAHQISNAKLAMWLYLASEVVVFGLLITVYLVFRFYNPDIVQEVQNELGLGLVSLNTFLLLSSSWAMVMGLRQAQLNNSQGLVRWISLTALLGASFVALQGVEYTELAHAGLSIGTELGMRFYAPTAFHGAHVIVGVLWALRVINRGTQRLFQRAKLPGRRNLRPVLALCRCRLALPVYDYLFDLRTRAWLTK